MLLLFSLYISLSLCYKLFSLLWCRSNRSIFLLKNWTSLWTISFNLRDKKNFGNIKTCMGASHKSKSQCNWQSVSLGIEPNLRLTARYLSLAFHCELHGELPNQRSLLQLQRQLVCMPRSNRCIKVQTSDTLASVTVTLTWREHLAASLLHQQLPAVSRLATREASPASWPHRYH
jgi:hypothetical protein